MNNKHQNYAELYQIVKKLFEQSPYLSSGPLDETYYTLRVFIEAENLIKFYRKTLANVTKSWF